MYLSWKTKALSGRRVSNYKKMLRWDVLGLQDPAKISCTPSIEDVRRQIISASYHGLSPATLARSHKKQERSKPRSKAPWDTRKHGAISE
jgi:hypothetical protein